MKAVVFLALLGVAAARPQIISPFFNNPLVTLKPADDSSQLITPLTYTYPTSSYGWPYNFPAYPFGPLIARPEAEKEPAERTKRSAEPEAEADPLTIYNSGIFPYNTPLTYTYPTSSYGWPYNFPAYPFGPIIANPVLEKELAKRSKRSAEPEPEAEADPLTIYNSGIFPSAMPFNMPFASTYSPFLNRPLTYSYPYTYPFNYQMVVKAE